MVGG
jgi:serine/threonine protein kinase